MHNQDSTSCAVWEEKLATTHPDDLSTLEREALETHLASCPYCQTIQRKFQRVNVLVRDAIAMERPLGHGKDFLTTKTHQHDL